MSLPALKLDNLSWEDLRVLALHRVPAASGGRWTHHAPVDAGITMLELFAFLLEQQLFVLDQVPDSLVHAILGLLGEAPRPTGLARTVVAVEPGRLGDFVKLPAAAAIRPTSAALGTLVFTTSEATLLPPVDSTGIEVDGENVTASLAQGRRVQLMPRNGAPGQLLIDIHFARPFRPEHAGAGMAIALVLGDTGVADEWSERAVEVPPPVKLDLQWSAGGTSGNVATWLDGTGGFRRSGLIRFDIPSAAVGQDRIQLTLLTDRAAHAEPPTLVSLHVGAVIAHHRFPRKVEAADTDDTAHDAIRAELWQQIERWLPISGLELVLPDTLTPVIEDSVRLRLKRPDGDWHDWYPVGDLTPLGPEDRALLVDRARGTLLFGDGYNGSVASPATNFTLELDTGGGPEGNHAAGMTWRPLDEPGADLRLVSVVAADGGTRAESLQQARTRVAASLTERHRAVTAQDFVTLVENAPGVGAHRAHVVAGHDPTFPCIHSPDSITVFVVPRSRREVTTPAADNGAMAMFRERLGEARMLTTRVFVARPVFRPLTLSVEISSATAAPARFAEVLRPLFSDYLHPNIGGPNGDGWPFGRAPRPSELMRVGQSSLAAENRIEKIAIQLQDEGKPAEDCLEVTIGANELVYLSRLTVRVIAGSAAGATL